MPDLSQMSDDELQKLHDSLPEEAPPQQSAQTTSRTVQDLPSMSDDELQKLHDSLPEAPSKLETAVSGLASGMTLGYSDEIAGAGRAALDKATGSSEPFGDLYTKYRDEQRAHIEANKAANPKTFLGSSMVGTGITASAPGMGAINPAVGRTMAGIAGRGALGGAIIGSGNSDAPVKSPQMLLDTGVGTVTGAAAGAAGGLLPKLAPDALRAVANTKAVKAAGAMTRELRDLGEQGVQKLGQILLNKKIVTMRSSLEDVASRAASEKELSGSAIGAALDKVDDLVKTSHDLIDSGKMFPGASDAQKEAAKQYVNEQFQFSGENIAKRIENEIIKPNSNAAGQYQPTIKNEMAKMQALADDFRTYGVSTLAQGTAMKAAQGAKTRFASETVPEAFKKEVYGILKTELENAVGKTANIEQAMAKAQPQLGVGQAPSTDALKQYLAAKQNYGAMSTAQDMAERSLGRTQANRAMSLTDYLAGIAGTAAHGLPTGAALAGVNKVIRRYGDSVSAVGLNKLASVIDKSPEAMAPWARALATAASNGGNSLAVTHALLLKNDPNYARAINQEGTSP